MSNQASTSSIAAYLANIKKLLSAGKYDFVPRRKNMQERASMKKYCEECGREVETKVITKKETYDVCSEPIEVDAQVLVCAECGEEFYCEEFDNATLINAYNEYRRRHKLLLPEEIKKIREQYGLSQRSFARLLNWGDKTICRYENGSIQDKAHNSLMLFLREPENIRTY